MLEENSPGPTFVRLVPRMEPPPILYREDKRPVEPMRFFAALCGADARLPLEQWQSPTVIKLIDRADFLAEGAKLAKEYRSLFLVTVYEPAATQIIRQSIHFPESPLRIEDFYLAGGALFTTRDDGHSDPELHRAPTTGGAQPDLPLPARPLGEPGRASLAHGNPSLTEAPVPE